MNHSESLSEYWSEKLHVAGFDGGSLLSQRINAESGGTDGEMIVDVGGLIVRLIRERGQDFVELAAQSRPREFLRTDDVFVALEFRQLDEVMQRNAPASLEEELGMVAQNSVLLQSTLDDPTWRQRFTDASTARERAFLDKLARLAAATKSQG